MATRKTPTKKPAAKKPATKRATAKAKPTATDKPVSAPVDPPEAHEATLTPDDVPEAASVDDAPNGGEVQVEDQQDGGSPGEAIEAEAAQPTCDATPEESVEDSKDQAAEDAASVQIEQDESKVEQPAASSDVITRKYKGVVYELHPQADGTFKLGDETFKSLTAAAQFLLQVTGGVSGPRWWLGASTSGSGKGGTRLTPEEQAVRAAQKAADKARKGEKRAKALRAAEVAALDELIAMIVKANEDGRLTEEQLERLRGIL